MSLPTPIIALLAVLCALVIARADLAAQQRSNANDTDQEDCVIVLKKLKAELAREPGRLILSVEDALTTSEVCACAIIRAAVGFAGSDTDLIARVVVEAIRVVPGAASEITECALKEAPEAAEAIHAVLTGELGQGAAKMLEPSSKPGNLEGGKAPIGKAPVPSGKEPSPAIEPAPGEEEPANSEPDWPSVGVSGIYLTSTARGNQRGTVIESLKFRIKSVSKVIYRPIFPVTRSIPTEPDGFFK